MTDRPNLTTEHYADALVLCRATLRNDEQGILAIAEHTPNVGMLMQALVRIHLMTLAAIADGDPQLVDQLLAENLAAVIARQTEPPC